MHSLQIPSNMNDTIDKMFKMSNTDFVQFVEETTQCIQLNKYQNINLQMYATKLKITLQNVEDIFGALLTIIRWCQQVKSQPDKEIKNDLIEQGFSAESANNFLNLIANKIDKRSQYSKYYLQIERLHWRIDISLYNTMKRAVSPTIIWKLTLNNGQQYIIEINFKKFQEIRFYITTLLNSLRRTRQQMLRF